MIGRDEFAGGAGKIHVSPRLMRALHSRGIFFWANAIRNWDGAIPIWKTTNELHPQ